MLVRWGLVYSCVELAKFCKPHKLMSFRSTIAVYCVLLLAVVWQGFGQTRRQCIVGLTVTCFEFVVVVVVEGVFGGGLEVSDGGYAKACGEAGKKTVGSVWEHVGV